MKKTKLTALLLAVLLTASAAFGCKKDEAPAPSSSAPSSAPSSASSSAPEISSSSSAPEASSSDSEEGEMVQSITTGNADFDKLFKDNPIDKAYVSDSSKALSNIEMRENYEKYAEIWQKEVDFSYKNLLGIAPESDREALKKEQTAWTDGKDAAMKKIGEEAQAMGGSLAQVTAAGEVMEYYRERDAKILLKLYGYGQDLSYQFQETAKG